MLNNLKLRNLDRLLYVRAAKNSVIAQRKCQSYHGVIINPANFVKIVQEIGLYSVGLYNIRRFHKIYCFWGPDAAEGEIWRERANVMADCCTTNFTFIAAACRPCGAKNPNPIFG